MACAWLLNLLLGLLPIPVGDGPGPGPDELVTRLGSPIYRDREAAGEALVLLGRSALPALSKASSSRDPEVRQRAGTLIVQIEAIEVLGATRVKLDVHDRTLAEAVAAFTAASGMTLKPGGSGEMTRVEPTWPDRRVTLEAANPLAFWEVLDRLCAAGGLQRDYPPAGTALFYKAFDPPFELTLVPGRARLPVSDVGSLRVELLRIRSLRDRDYGAIDSGIAPLGGSGVRRREAEPGATERLSDTAELLVSAEPRLRIFRVGDPEKLEAVDLEGRSLLKRPTAEEEERQLQFWQMNPQQDPRIHASLRYGSGSRRSTQAWPFSVPLTALATPSQRVAMLRGIVPVVVVARKPDPLVIELKDASGRDFSSGATRITVHSVKAESGREPTVDFTLVTDTPGQDGTFPVVDTKGARLIVNPPLDLMELRLEVLGAQGEPLTWQYQVAPNQGSQGRMTIVIRDRNSKRPRPEDLQLRYWGVIGAATDVPFAFRDLSTP